MATKTVCDRCNKPMEPNEIGYKAPPEPRQHGQEDPPQFVSVTEKKEGGGFAIYVKATIVGTIDGTGKDADLCVTCLQELLHKTTPADRVNRTIR